MKVHYFIVLVLIIFNLFSSPAQAQIDPGCSYIVQYDKVVGVIYVPERELNSCKYMEHWYLFGDYKYPNAKNQVKTVIEPADLVFDNFETFLKDMREHDASGRYVEVWSHEHRAECGG